MDTLREGLNLIFCGKRGDGVFAKYRPLFPLILFLLIHSAMPSTATNVYTYLSINVSVQTWQYNFLNISTSVFSLIASFVYNRFLIGKDLAVIIVWTAVASCLTSLLQIYFVTGLFDDKNVLFWVTIVIMDINAFASQLAFIPMLIMVSRSCPVGYESSMWATFFTFNDIAGTISGTIVGVGDLSDEIGLQADAVLRHHVHGLLESVPLHRDVLAVHSGASGVPVLYP